MTGKFDDGGPSRPRRPETLSDLPRPQNQAAPPVVDEPTQTLPTVQPLKVAARAVIVYQEAVRRPWRLWAFTAVLVALTVGVVLGQTVAFEPTYRSNANANAAVVPAPVPSSSPAPVPSWPDAAHRVTAPLGAAKIRTLVLTGTSAVLHVRSADLGASLYEITTVDRSAVPRVTGSGQTATLELIPTGDDGTVGADIRLNSRVAWTLRLAGGLGEQSVDMQAGGLAALELTGGSARTSIVLPAPTGTVPVSVRGPLAELTVSSRTGAPVRLKLAGGAKSAVVDGRAHPSAKPGTTITTNGWTKARNRYDLTATGPVTAAQVATT